MWERNISLQENKVQKKRRIEIRNTAHLFQCQFQYVKLSNSSSNHKMRRVLNISFNQQPWLLEGARKRRKITFDLETNKQTNKKNPVHQPLVLFINIPNTRKITVLLNGYQVHNQFVQWCTVDHFGNQSR